MDIIAAISLLLSVTLAIIEARRRIMYLNIFNPVIINNEPSKQGFFLRFIVSNMSPEPLSIVNVSFWKNGKCFSHKHMVLDMRPGNTNDRFLILDLLPISLNSYSSREISLFFDLFWSA